MFKRLKEVIGGTWRYFWLKRGMNKLCDTFHGMIDGVADIHEHGRNCLLFCFTENEFYIIHSDGRLYYHLDEGVEVGCSKGKSLYSKILSVYVRRI